MQMKDDCPLILLFILKEKSFLFLAISPILNRLILKITVTPNLRSSNWQKF